MHRLIVHACSSHFISPLLLFHWYDWGEIVGRTVERHRTARPQYGSTANPSTAPKCVRAIQGRRASPDRPATPAALVGAGFLPREHDFEFRASICDSRILYTVVYAQ